MVQEMAKQNALLQILAKDSIKTLTDDWGVCRGLCAPDPQQRYLILAISS